MTTEVERFKMLSQSIRDPERWFCGACDETGIPRVWARGDSHNEAFRRTLIAAAEYVAEKSRYRVVKINEWQILIWPPAHEKSLMAVMVPHDLTELARRRIKLDADVVTQH